MIKAIKAEITRRRVEELTYQDAIKAEKTRLSQARANAKKSILRNKIKSIDNIKSKMEAKEDKKSIDEFSARLRTQITIERRIRKEHIIAESRHIIMLSIIICLALIAGGIAIGYSAHRSNIQQAYSEAVNYIIDGEYETAKVRLEKLGTQDSDALLDYCESLLNVSEYNGKPNKIKKKLESITEIENDKINSKKDYYVKELIESYEVQEDINGLTEDDIFGQEKNTKQKSV